MHLSETTEINVSEAPIVESPVYLVYPRRFYVLFVFSFLTFNQCTIWLTFSPIARNAEAYYNITETTIDLLLNWGPIIFIPCLPLTSILLNKPNGLRYCVIILAITDFIAALARILPSIIVKATSANFNSVALPFIHAGQILNAACGPLVMAPVSQLSCVWFAPHERTRATTVALFAHGLGASIGFLTSPYIVSKPEHVHHLLYLHFGLAFVACFLALLYFPAQPPSSPSAAAELLIHNPTSAENNHDWRTFLKDIWTCLSNPAFLFLSTAGGLIYGTFGAWTGLYDILLKPEGYSEADAGWFGFASSLAGIFGGLVLSSVADQRRFQHSLKAMMMTALIVSLLAIVWFELCVHSLFYDKHILSSSVATIGLSTGLAGLFSGAASPLFYEAVAEIMYPLPASLSASILVQWMNVVSLVFLFVAPNRGTLVNFIVLVVMTFGLILISITRFSYRRRDEDERKRLEKEQNQLMHDDNCNERINNGTDEERYGTFTTSQSGSVNQLLHEDSNNWR